MKKDKDNVYLDPSPYWSFVKKAPVPQESFGAEIAPQFILIDIHGPELIELHEKIRNLQEKLEKLEQKETEQKETKDIIPINFLETEKLKLKRPFNVVLEFHSKDNLYIIDSLELNIYGSGADELSALEDFKIVLEEYYFSLKDDRDNLAPALKEKWEILKGIIKEK